MSTRELIRDVILSDGSTLRLRAPGPGDVDDIKAFYGIREQCLERLLRERAAL